MQQKMQREMKAQSEKKMMKILERRRHQHLQAQRRVYNRLKIQWKAKNMSPFLCKISNYGNFDKFEHYKGHTKKHRKGSVNSQQHHTKQLSDGRPTKTTTSKRSGVRTVRHQNKGALKDDKGNRKHDKKEKLHDARPGGAFDVHFPNVDYKCTHCAESLPNIDLFMKHILEAHPGVISHMCKHCNETFEDDSSLRLHKMTHHEASLSDDATRTSLNLEKTLPDSFKFISCDIKNEHATECEGNIGDTQTESEQSIGNDLKSASDWAFGPTEVLSSTQPSQTEGDQRTLTTPVVPSGKAKSSPQQRSSTSVKEFLKTSSNDIDPSHQVGSDSTIEGAGQFKYRCVTCKKSFLTPDLLISHHAKMHKKSHRCPHCSKSFVSVLTLELHMTKLHKDGMIEEGHQTDDVNYKCAYCAKKFHRKSALVKHIRIHWVCQECSKVCKSVKALSVHKKESHKKSMYICGCGQTFDAHEPFVRHSCGVGGKVKNEKGAKESTKRSPNTSKQATTQINQNTITKTSHLVKTEDHIYTETKEKPSTTTKTKEDTCKETFQDTPTLENHRISDTSDKCYKCEPCQKSFSDPTKLVQHIKEDGTHRKRDACPICGKLYKRTQDIPDHVMDHYGLKLHTCTKCDKRFTFKATLRQHMVMHSGRYKCDECGKHCESKLNLEHHKRTHNNVVLYTCPLCHKDFKCKQNEKGAKNHKCVPITHVNKKDTGNEGSDNNEASKLYTCEHCEKSYAIRQSLLEHKRLKHSDHTISETSEKCFKCEPCLKSFSDLTKLVQHIKEDGTHRKPDTCPICGKVYKRTQDIPDHVMDHYGLKLHTCTKCDKRFAFKATLRQHMVMHSGRYKCDECDKHCESKLVLECHKRKHNNVVLYTCPLCHKDFKCKQNEKGAKNHKCVPITHVNKKDTGNEGSDYNEASKLYTCEHCEKSYAMRQSLLEHKRLKHGKRPDCFKCEQCEKSYSWERALKKHIRAVHSGERNICTYLCPLCGKQYSNKQYLKIHTLAAHSVVKPFPCTTCQRRFSSRNCLREHISRKHTNHRPHLCESCGARFLTKFDFTIHIRVHHKAMPFKCGFCDKKFPIKYLMKNHERLHTGEKPYKCTECDESFRTSELLNQHKKVIHTKDNPNVCSICNEVCANPGNLKQHMKIHIKPYQCLECGKGFARRRECKNHELIHTGEKPHKCSYCNKSFRESGTKKRHEITHTGEKPHQCSYCIKSFSRVHDKKQHEMTHTGEKPHQCSYCNKSFNRLHNKKQHELTHAGEKPRYCNKSFSQLEDKQTHELMHPVPLKCRYCNKSFSGLEDKQTHELMHTGEKPHKCTYCDKSFSQLGNKNEHELTHTGENPHNEEKPFKCRFCDKSFARKNRRNEHERIHSGELPRNEYHMEIEKPFKCRFCDKSYARKFRKNEHEQVHTGALPYKCLECDKQYHRVDSLKQHIKLKHTKNNFVCSVCNESCASPYLLKKHMNYCRGHT